jgi:hypothetical protein
MSMPRTLPRMLVVCGIASLVAAAPAAAYIDPGTGSVAIQLLVAGVLGAAFGIKRFWKKITAPFRSPSKRP